MRPLSIVIGGVFVLGAFAACSDDDGTATTTEAAVVTEAPATTDSVDWSATCGEYEGRDADDTAQVEAICATAAAFMEAINTYDSEALLAVTTEDFTYQTTGDPFTRDEFIPYFEANYEAGNFTVTGSGQLVTPDGMPVLGDDGQPRPGIFLPDELHLNRQGYEIWTKVVRAGMVAVEAAWE